MLGDPGGVLVTECDAGADPEALGDVDAEVGGAVVVESLSVADPEEGSTVETELLAVVDSEVGGVVDGELLVVVGGGVVIVKGANSPTTTLPPRHCAAMYRYSPGWLAGTVAVTRKVNDPVGVATARAALGSQTSGNAGNRDTGPRSVFQPSPDAVTTSPAPADGGSNCRVCAWTVKSICADGASAPSQA